MEPAKLRYWILGWFSMALCCYCTSDTFTQRDNHPHAWKKLYLAHHWPVTVCKMIANDCHDPPKYWTIHGLWPDRAEDCNRTWHFNVTEIKDLLSDMRHYWPDVLHSSLNRTQFWKHEWDKHGTCAASLEVLNSQKKYFGKALELYQHVDLNGCLLKAGIKPGSTYYKMTDIKEVLTRFYGVTPKIQCLPPEEGEEAQTIGQIEFCFTKELQLINCTALKSESNPVQAHLKLGTEELSVTCLVDVEKDVDIVYVDFSGAFDTISHSTLLEKLAAHGLDRDYTHSQLRAVSVAFHQNVYGFKSWIKAV